MIPPESEQLEAKGRQIRLVPLPRGSWTVLLGCFAMLLGPLFGFLIGATLDTAWETFGMDPISFFLFVGFLVAGVGAGVALIGVRRLMRDRMNVEPRDDPSIEERGEV